MRKILIVAAFLLSIMAIGTACNDNASTTGTSTTDSTNSKDSATAEPEMSQPH